MRAGRSGLAIRIGLGVLGLIVLLLVAMTVRALTWQPGPETPATVELADLPAVEAEDAARRLAQAVQFQTLSHVDPAADDLGQWTGFHAWLVQTYPAAHEAMTRETVAGRTLIYSWPGEDSAAAPVVLLAHQDVVPAVPETLGDWTHPPFAGVIADGHVWGRGTLDDKGSLIAIMEAVETLARQGRRPARTVMLVFGHDEEVAGTGAQAAAAWLTARGIRPAFVLDEGGLTLTQDPLTGRPMAMIAVAEKGYGTLRLTARGQGGHSSMPGAETAVSTLALAIRRLVDDPYPIRLDGPGGALIEGLASGGDFATRFALANRWLLGSLVEAQLAADPAAAAMLRTTFAPTMLSGSPKENVLPDVATGLVNVRLHPRDTPDQVLARVRDQLAGLEVEVEWAGRAEPASPVSPSSGEGWDLIAALAAETTEARVFPGLLVGATDARHFTEVSDRVYRYLPVRLEPSDLERLHGVDERISVENLARMIRFYAGLMMNL